MPNAQGSNSKLSVYEFARLWTKPNRSTPLRDKAKKKTLFGCTPPTDPNVQG